MSYKCIQRYITTYRASLWDVRFFIRSFIMAARLFISSAKRCSATFADNTWYTRWIITVTSWVGTLRTRLYYSDLRWIWVWATWCSFKCRRSIGCIITTCRFKLRKLGYLGIICSFNETFLKSPVFEVCIYPKYRYFCRITMLQYNRIAHRQTQSSQFVNVQRNRRTYFYCLLHKQVTENAVSALEIDIICAKTRAFAHHRSCRNCYRRATAALRAHAELNLV